MNDKPHLDEEALTELQDVMEDEFDVLIETYLKDSSDRISHLRSAIGSADPDAFARTAHSFKGSSINIGAPMLGELCLRAEEAGKDNRLDEASDVVDAIEVEFQRIEQTLKRFLA
ncbi:Hpt domain-containing protein [Marinobacter confluentis]|uniref:Hpt domain-containing protein n=1 Tax=Marinobacter confluentis TaxID=1697557 RepID=A0A4Z1BMH4_9GAMM|nr:Hpt domain-containing protein [Marinobacter confluentis]TGN41227.1 Hpt domain-containing protein [Marinobacter confluentis]